MKNNYRDIMERIKEPPSWYDENGTPRYGNFEPDLNPSIYDQKVVLLLIACQHCGRKFRVSMSAGHFNLKRYLPRQWHYGDPPAHNCTGDSMNCIDLEVLEVWERGDPFEDYDWHRISDQEGVIE